MKNLVIGLVVIQVTIFGLASVSEASLINGGFETPVIEDNSFVQIPESTSGLGWQTTATDDLIELWRQPFKGVLAYEGYQFAELNATQVSTLYQDVTGIAAGLTVGWEFAHRGRSGNDTLARIITDLGQDDTWGGGATSWGFHSGVVGSLTLGNSIRFAWSSISSVGGATYGNFLDAADFGVGVGQVPEPATMLLFGAGLAGLAGVRMRRKKQ